MISLFFGLTALAFMTVMVHICTCTSGTFNVLTMNVAGLPPYLNGNDVPGDKATNARTIGSRFAQYGYDMIHVQEDFNYHAEIYSTDNHLDRTSTSGPAGFGSGLNTLSNFSWTEFTRIEWNECSDASGWDCLTPKGFTFMRMTVADGVSVDLYNLHTDAGTEPGDEDARTSNIQQVVDYIASNSNGNAVLVFGDTNSRYTRTADNIAIFTTQSGLTDAWALLEHNNVPPSTESDCANPSTTNTCETVDKVFFRSNSIVSLNALSFSYESYKFLQKNGDILSDHNPVSVSFQWTLSSSRRQSALFGSTETSRGGTWFNDLTSLPTSPRLKISSISFQSSNTSTITAMSLTHASGQIYEHGVKGGTSNSQTQTQTETITLREGESWLAARVCQGGDSSSNNTHVISILATMSTGRTLGIGQQINGGDANEDANCVTFTAEPLWQIVGFLGRQNEDGELGQVGFVYGLT